MLTGGVILSSLEYPGKISLVIFTGGCSLRCPYCHNPELIAGGDETSFSTIMKEIDESLDFIDAIVITGGEPTMQIKEVGQILEYSRRKGLKTKLDTNGCNPESLQEILELVDYVALDIKAPFSKYKKIIGEEIGEKVKKSMEIVADSNVFLECRTTYVPGLLNPEDVYNIARTIKCDIYTLQQFRNRVVLDEKLKNTPNTDPKELKEIALKIKPQLGKVKIKTSQFGEEII
ncbi:MAG: pyruvate formate lyase activating enzyme [Methanobacterium sp.]|jgi:pyruvate formate lyase activating enzyme|uniref:anaerobic ribonucleoside-triphosphate reductase activating protein n=1 Tax=Methanobacterium sp. TaxID=2164 RepID=UPI0003C98EE2|nr:anaerobic ribonucleoside-triphosphate reductase activating protein [Methanobacterium sp.]MDI3550519.1 pyruvate formate lyase activating enzyme [Methanobacterium sp.]CDG64513.1 anaerobic ribonucleoside-triphosphate reductase activating protein [Methanobacterium sp. MB1]